VERASTAYRRRSGVLTRRAYAHPARAANRFAQRQAGPLPIGGLAIAFPSGVPRRSHFHTAPPPLWKPSVEVAPRLVEKPAVSRARASSRCATAPVRRCRNEPAVEQRARHCRSRRGAAVSTCASARRPERSSRSPALRRLLHLSERERGGLAARRGRATSKRLDGVSPRERGFDARGATGDRRDCMAPSLRAARYSTGPSHDQCGRVRSSGTISGRS
jgi:hypothetical protein